VVQEDPKQRFSPSELQRSKYDADEYPHADQTSRVIGAAIEVHRALGPGFLEAVYEEALALELENRKIPYERQRIVRVRYRGATVGVHRIDLITDGKIVVELKAVKAIEDIHLAVTLSYLKATSLPVGLIINFAEATLRVRRVAGGSRIFNAEALKG
jgi:GxxExxY protein